MLVEFSIMRPINRNDFTIAFNSEVPFGKASTRQLKLLEPPPDTRIATPEFSYECETHSLGRVDNFGQPPRNLSND